MNTSLRKLLPQSQKLIANVNKQFSPSAIVRYSSTSLKKSQCKLVIFDKDGTLTCFNSMWAPWCEATASRLENASGKKLSEDLFEYFNYDKTTQRFGRSILAHDTHGELKEGLVDVLAGQHGIDIDEAKSLISHAWVDSFDSTDKCHTLTVKPLGDVQSVFRTLKENDIKIAVCTADSRIGAELSLEALGVADVIDRLVCGDDADNTPKPAPDNIRMICEDLDVKVEDTVMIGDTHFDTVMGRDSNCGTVIGVLSGQVEKSDLKDAHYVVNSIDEALPILLNGSDSNSLRNAGNSPRHAEHSTRMYKTSSSENSTMSGSTSPQQD
ncbi:phosphoglycolate phosphatase-like [Styela clava]